MNKQIFEKSFKRFLTVLQKYVSDESDFWTIKGFIDINKNLYTISSDTKIISKILEIHIFHLINKFAKDMGFKMELAKEQNYYPDMSFVLKKDVNIKFAVDIKTSYRDLKREGYCNGFTLGSHGQYFVDRQSSKNIQFPYESYAAHYCLGILYTRNENIDEKKIYKLDNIVSIASVIKNIEFFFIEKWKIASDKSGSGNTANIGSVKKIDDLLFGNGTFAKYGETIFDDYWINYGKITIKNKNGNLKKITNIDEFLQYRGILKK